MDDKGFRRLEHANADENSEAWKAKGGHLKPNPAKPIGAQR
jgi:hypothetical protein